MESVESWKSTETGLSYTLSPTAELSDSRRNNGEILKIEFINNLKDNKKEKSAAYLAYLASFSRPPQTPGKYGVTA